jgi:hypothetical protein
MKTYIKIIISVLALFIASSSFANDEGNTVVGKITSMDQNEIIISADDRSVVLLVNELKKTTRNFRQCIDNGEYKGLIEITTSEFEGYDPGVDLFVLNNKATCKRKLNQQEKQNSETALAPDPQSGDISGIYTYQYGNASFWINNTIKITKVDSDAYFVKIVAAAKGGMGASSSVFYGTCEISEDSLMSEDSIFVFNILTHKGKYFPVLFTIHIRRNLELDNYARMKKASAFSSLKPGQIAVIKEGGLPSQFPKELAGYWKLGERLQDGDNLWLPDWSSMFEGQFREASFDAVYTKKKTATAPAAQ